MRACLLTFSVIGDDPRVRRQGDALAAAGWEVTALGLGPSRSAPPSWKVVEVASPPQREVWRRAVRAAALAVGGRVPAVATAIHHRALFRSFSDARRDAPQADLYIANDWPMLPVAEALAHRSGGRYVYDSHEFATAEYSASRKWRLVNLPYVRAIESRYIAGAATVLTVSDGIADALHRLYALPERPAVIRNVPGFREVLSHSVDGRQITLLYHGLVAPGRGLEELIVSVGAWRPEFRLIIRGPASAEYGAHLRGLATAHGLDRRIEFAPAISPDRLVEEAAKADIGVFALPDGTLNATHALPNKFFEYIMAGLALCMTNLPEMAGLVRRFDLGRLIASKDASAIAAAVNGFTPAEISRYRANALVAARELNWQRESNRLVEACEQAVSRRD